MISQVLTETLPTPFAASLSLPESQEILCQFLSHICQGPAERKAQFSLLTMATGFGFSLLEREADTPHPAGAHLSIPWSALTNPSHHSAKLSTAAELQESSSLSTADLC